MDIFLDTLHSWQSFYFMLGGASAALLGLMFVALSLGQHMITKETRENFEHFTEPSIFYFASVIVIAAAMLVPRYDPMVFAWIVLVGGVISLALTGGWVRHLIRAAKQYGDFNLGDWLALVIMPLVSYGMIIAAGGFFAALMWSAGFSLIAIASVLIMLIGIVNTWGIVIVIIYRRTDED